MKKIFNLKFCIIYLIMMLFASMAYARSDSGKFIELGKTIYNHGNVHLAKLKDGRILIADFDVLPTDMNKKLDEKDKYLKKFEIYNPKTRKFEHMAQPIYWHSSSQPIVLDDGRVFIAGNTQGRYKNLEAKDNDVKYEYSEIYDPKKNEFKLTSKMQIPRTGFGVTKLQDGRILITGGLYFDKNNYTVNKYDGSVEVKSKNDPQAEIFDPKTETFSLTGKSDVNIIRELTDDRSRNKFLRRMSNLDGQAITLDNGDVLVLWTTEGAAEIYNPNTGQFRRVSDMVRARRFGWPPVSVNKLKDGRVIVISGPSPETWNTAEIFDPKTETFIDLGKMVADHGTSGIYNTIVLKNGQVLIFGGSKGSDSFPPREIILKSMELFDPQTNKFNYIGEKKSKDVSGKSILLNDGNVFFISNCSKYKYKHTCGELYIPNYK